MSRNVSLSAAADHFVYRCYDATGLLIYIGCTSNVQRRMAAHQRGENSTSRWIAACMDRFEIEGPYSGRDAGRAAERRAINTEQPLFNYQERAKERLAAWMTRRPVALYLVERGLIELAAETICTCDPEARSASAIDSHCVAHVAAKVAGLTDMDEFDWSTAA